MPDDSGTTPLLQVAVQGDRNSPAGHLHEAAPDVEQEVGHDLQRCLYRHPREAIRHLENKGVKKLGTFQVQTNKVPELFEKNGLYTFGAEEEDLEWDTVVNVWRERLHAKNLPNSGPDWEPVTQVDAYVVSVQHAADNDDDGIVNPLLKRYYDHVCGIRVFAFPAVKAVLNFKWQTWARRYLLWELTSYLIWLISLQAFSLLLQDEDTEASLRTLLHAPRGIITVALEIISVIAMLPFVYIEYRSIAEYREDWFNYWNMLDVIAYTNQIAILVIHLGRWHVGSNWFSCMVAIQVLLLWVHLQYFARVLQPTKNPFMETLRAVVAEVKWFLFLLLLLIWGFSCSFNILMRKDQEKKEFRSVMSSVVTMFGIMLSGYDLELFSSSHNPVVAVILLIAYVFIMSMVLLNCLIALMSDACAKVNDEEGWQFFFCRAQIIDELETTVPDWVKLRNAGTWYPKYVHYLQINHSIENLSELELGGGATIEDDGPHGEASEDEQVQKDKESSKAEDASSGGNYSKLGQPTDMQKELQGVKEELESVKAQMAQLLSMQETLARHLLPKGKES